MIEELQTCKTCGEPLTQINGKGHRKREYCTARCKQHAYRQRSAPPEQEAAEPAEERIAALERELQQLRTRLDIEERYRMDTEVRHFKNWLRRQHQPRDTDFFKRFLADTRLPQHASKSLYLARLRLYQYSAEDIYLFQEAWKDLLLQT